MSHLVHLHSWAVLHALWTKMAWRSRSFYQELQGVALQVKYQKVAY